MSNYFTQATASQKGLAADASSNITVGNHQTGSNYSIRVTSGIADQVYIDICGANATIPDAKATGVNTLKLRVDTLTNDGEFINSYVTPSLYLNDISAVAGNIAVGTLSNVDNIGKKLTAAPFLPMYFRTLCGDTIAQATNRAIRVTLKDDVKLKNGMKLNIYARHAADSADLNISTVDVSFDASGWSPGQILVNGGPLGADQGISPFRAEMTKNATTATSGDVKVYTQTPMFKNGGDGIDLSGITFRIKEYSATQGGSGKEFFATVSIPANEKNDTQLPNEFGEYVYDVSTLLQVSGKSYRVMNTSVTDKYNVYGYAMQNSLNGLINISNTPTDICHNDASFNVDADAFGQDATFRTGTKAILNFVTPNTAEGPKSLAKYEARWFTRAQAASLGDVPLNFDVIKANFPNQVNIQTDICATTGALFPSVTLTGLTPSVVNADGTSDNNTRYGVFARAYTLDDDGNYVAGTVNPVDTSLSMMASPTGAVSSNSASLTGVSLGFFVSGVPDAPTPIAVRTGKDVLLTTTNTTTDIQKDVSMDNNLMLVFNDYNVNQRGSNYDAIRYAIVRAKDAEHGDKMFDASFATTTFAFNGNDNVAETLAVDGAAALTGAWDAVNQKWVAAATNTTDLSNGEDFAVSWAFDNSNGIGFRTPWYTFTPSTHADASAGLYGLDASTNTRTGATGAGWGYGFGAAVGGAGIITQANYVAITDTAAREKRLALDLADNKIAFGFSLLDASGVQAKNAGLPYKSPALLDGGSEVNAIRYYVNLAPALTSENTLGKAARIYGVPNKDVSGTNAGGSVTQVAYVQSADANKDTNRLVVTQGYDGSGALTNLKNGQLYDICFSLANANGHNDLSFSALRGFAPMGKIQALKNVKMGTEAPKMNNTAGTTQCTITISFEDLSGVAEHGGHLINQISYNVTQYQGESRGDVVVLAATSTNTTDSATGYRTKATSTQVADLTLNTVGSTSAVRPGYPLKFTIYPGAVQDSTATAGFVKQVNAVYQNGVNVSGEGVTITLPGPQLAGLSLHDEVRALDVIPADGKLKVSFYKPQNDQLKNQYQGAPSVNAYYIYQYDMSLASIGSTDLGMSRSVKVISDINDIQSDFLETELAGINGKGYVVAVHTQWRYGVNNDTLQVSKGVYHTNLASALAVNDPSQNAAGLYTLPAAARATGNNNLRLQDLAIPRGAPTIVADNSRMVFDDNGDQLTFASMIQIAPQNSSPSAQPGTTTAFFLDLCSNASPSANSNVRNSTGIKVQPYNGHALNRRTYDICATVVLGANWANEKNFVVIQNNAGSAYIKRNIE
jgi:hypothetical protein